MAICYLKLSPYYNNFKLHLLRFKYKRPIRNKTKHLQMTNFHLIQATLIHCPAGWHGPVPPLTSPHTPSASFWQATVCNYRPWCMTATDPPPATPSTHVKPPPPSLHPSLHTQTLPSSRRLRGPGLCAPSRGQSLRATTHRATLFSLRLSNALFYRLGISHSDI